MNQSLARKLVIVTGGAQGIGRGISECFLHAGATVLIADRHAPADLSAAQARYAPRLSWVETDVTSTESIKALAHTVDQQFGGTDVLINNAGIMFEKSIEEQTEADWDLMMAVNLKGPIMVTKYLLAGMYRQVEKNGTASIVNIGSVEGYACNPKHTAYAASKGGIHGLTPAMAVDLGPRGIRVNAIAPGWIDTDLNRRYVESVDDVAQAKRALAELHPVGYIGSSKDVGDVAVWLASDAARFVSGQLITVDGARTKQLSLPAIFAR